MLNIYLVTYDIADSARLREVYKMMRRFGEHIQLSVFRCSLNERNLVLMKSTLLDVINSSEDQVLIVNLGPDEGRGANAIISLGKAFICSERNAIVV